VLAVVDMLAPTMHIDNVPDAMTDTLCNT